MAFLTSIFGAKAPTTSAARSALARVEAELAAAPARLAAADAVLARVADLSPAEHAAAEDERDEARRSATRLEAQVTELRRALADAEKAEAAAALAARAKSAAAKLAGYGALVREHDDRAASLAETLAKMAEIEAEVDAVNREIVRARKAGLAPPAEVETPDARFRAEPDVVTPERKVVDEKAQFRDGDRWIDVGVKSTVGGKLVLNAGEHLRKVERVIPGSTRAGRRISSPTRETVIAPARISGAKFWPRA